ncbi:MAG: transcriptional regulator [Rhodanobacter sp.]
MNSHDNPSSSAPGAFAERIKLLIQRVGSATEIARKCGFSEGVVRSWRDGNTDPSRARCVTLARTLGVSLVWLVAGEGSLLIDPNTPTIDEQSSSEKAPSRRLLGLSAGEGTHHVGRTVDAKRLSTAVKILQSELSLAGREYSIAEHTELLSELYEILGPGGLQVDPMAMVTFSHQLSARLHREVGAA